MIETNESTFWYTNSERDYFSNKAHELLCDLANNRLEVGLVPAPNPQHYCHMIRVAFSHNPKWYSNLYNSVGVTRKCVEGSLERIIKGSDLPRDKSRYDNLLRELIFEYYKKEKKEGETPF